MRYELERVHHMPKDLRPGVLYVSDEFKTAAHLCACGCGTKVRTPLGSTEWTVDETADGPTVRPSIGNWQLPCRSHYMLIRGEVVWADQWSEKRVEAGRRHEASKRQKYYAGRTPDASTTKGGLLGWLMSLFR